MIVEIDHALEALLHRELGDRVAISFTAPGRVQADQEGGAKGTVLDLHLLDVREEAGMKAAGIARSRQADGTVVEIGPTRWFRLSYWLTAWAEEPGAEHDALGAALIALAGHDAMPPDLLPDGLGAADRPVRLEVALPPAGDAFALNVWSSLRMPMKGAIHVAVLAPVAPGEQAAPAEPVVERRLRMTGPPPKPEPAIMPPPGVPPALMPPVPAPAAAAPAAAGAGPAAPAPATPAVDAKPPDPEPKVVEDLLYGPDRGAPPRPGG